MVAPVTDGTLLAPLGPVVDVAWVVLQQRVEYRGPTVGTVLAAGVGVGVASVVVGFLVGIYRAGDDRTTDGPAGTQRESAPGDARPARPSPTTGRAQGRDDAAARRDTATQGGDDRTTGGDRLSASGDDTVPGRDGTPAAGTARDTSASSRTRVPVRIPRAPDVSVDHDALVDREPIGGGGNADVERATLPTPNGAVELAVKTPRLSGTLHADTVERLLDEAETWDKLDDHDHVVGVVDYGAEPLPWIAMEYMDAGHLGARAGSLPLDQALWTAIGVTKGVRHAHRRGVAHLDLKPANVLFRSVEEAWAVPKVADWGLSKHLLDHSASIEGLSPQYAAPEQFDDALGPADDLTDVYQLGALFYELFTGRPPFEGNATQVMRAVLDEEPTPPSHVADVPAELDDVLLTALATEKADRYDSVVYVRDALQELYEAQ